MRSLCRMIAAQIYCERRKEPTWNAPGLLPAGEDATDCDIETLSIGIALDYEPDCAHP